MQWAWENGTRVLTLADLDRATEILVRAFAHDPLHRFLIGERADWESVSRALMGRMVLPCTRYGRAYGIGEPLAGVAIMLPGPSGRPGLRSLPILASYLWQFGLKTFSHSIRCDRELGWRRPQRRHMHLSCIGVDPSLQRRGIGRRLHTRPPQQGRLASGDRGLPRDLEGGDPPVL